jgi:hypothetical protein
LKVAEQLQEDYINFGIAIYWYRNTKDEFQIKRIDPRSWKIK